MNIRINDVKCDILLCLQNLDTTGYRNKLLNNEQLSCISYVSSQPNM